jgi:hypothetical protein
VAFCCGFFKTVKNGQNWTLTIKKQLTHAENTKNTSTNKQTMSTDKVIAGSIAVYFVGSAIAGAVYTTATDDCWQLLADVPKRTTISSKILDAPATAFMGSCMGVCMAIGLPICLAVAPVRYAVLGRWVV